MNPPKLTVCFILFFGLLDDAAMAALFGDEFWSGFDVYVK